VVLPGSKTTLADLAWLRARGLDAAIVAHARAGGLVLGLCGGMQMLGMRVADPHDVEGGGSAPGLGLLALETSLATTKTVRRVGGTALAPGLAGATFRGYEIHAGVSQLGAARFARVRVDGSEEAFDDGAVAENGRVVGTYVHGLLDEDAFRHAVIAGWRAARGLEPATRWSSYTAARGERIDRWARHVAAHVDVDALA
jgi:adenosylcobyric acid synthase